MDQRKLPTTEDMTVRSPGLMPAGFQLPIAERLQQPKCTTPEVQPPTPEEHIKLLRKEITDLEIKLSEVEESRNEQRSDADHLDMALRILVDAGKVTYDDVRNAISDASEKLACGSELFPADSAAPSQP